MSTTLTSAGGESTQSTLSAAELLFADFDSEHAATRRLLKLFPEGRGEWRPHERSRTLLLRG